MPNLSRFSRWSTAVRTVSVILRWRNRAKRQHGTKAAAENGQSVEVEAEALLMKMTQQEVYAAELRDLKAGVPLDRKNPLSTLTVTLMDGLICLDSRTRRSPEMSTWARFSVILPRAHQYTRLHIHEKTAHRAHDAVLVEVRLCWVPQAAREIRKVVSQSQMCKIRKAKPATPQMAPLLCRESSCWAERFVPRDLIFWVRGRSKKGRAVSKIWGALFRCMATKAVHIELTERLDTDATLVVTA